MKSLEEDEPAAQDGSQKRLGRTGDQPEQRPGGGTCQNGLCRELSPPLPPLHLGLEQHCHHTTHTCLTVACRRPERGEKQSAGDLGCASAHPVVGDADCSLTASARVLGTAGGCAVLGHSVVSDSLTPRTVACQFPLSLGTLQAGILEWVAMPSSRGSSLPRDQTSVSYLSCIGRRLLTISVLNH